MAANGKKVNGMIEKRTFKLAVPKDRRTFQVAEKPAFFKAGDPFRKARSSKRWQRLREMFLRREPVCWICHARAAVELHHITEAHVDPSLFWEVSNLAPVCEGCHKKVHASYRRGLPAEMFFPKEKRLQCLA